MYRAASSKVFLLYIGMLVIKEQTPIVLKHT